MKWAWILVITATGGCAPETPAAGREPITVFAAASLEETLTAIGREWQLRGGAPVRFQFEASSRLARQIEEGAAADVFVSAAPEWLDRLAPERRCDWIGNRLVCVVPAGVERLDLARVGSLALAGDQVPAGRYAKAALDRLGIPLPSRVLYGSSVRDVLSMIAEGGAEAGIVYATDAAVEPRVRIAYTFPAESHPRIVYSTGLLRPAGRALFDALREPWARAIALEYGFVELP